MAEGRLLVGLEEVEQAVASPEEDGKGTRAPASSALSGATKPRTLAAHLPWIEVTVTSKLTPSPAAKALCIALMRT